MSWDVVIGLEVHVRLMTRTKLFSGSTNAFGAEPNTQVSAVDLGLPGVLPVLNREAVTMAIRLGVALGAEINQRSVFVRKNYFYPDLPKGYQISQLQQPIIGCGALRIAVPGAAERDIRIHHAHLEEDAGKSVHNQFAAASGIDLNRAGTPLIEIVSEPDLRSAAEAGAYLRKLHALVVNLGVCDGDMSQGSFRCDANISIRPTPDDPLGVRAELKNINSFRFVEQALEGEIARQMTVLESGGALVQETRLYDAERDESRPMRDKEAENDYRYFPDPDLLPLYVDEDWIASVRKDMPEMPEARRERYANLGIAADSAAIIAADRSLSDYFAAALNHCDDPAALANWLTGAVAAALNRDELDIAASPVSPKALGRLLSLIADGTINRNIAKTVFDALWNGEGAGDPDTVISARRLEQVTDTSAIEKAVQSVIAEHPDQVAQYRDGKTKVLGFLVGMVIKATGGKADPKAVNELVRKHLE